MQPAESLLSFLETITKAKTFLEEHGRVSLRALKREFDLDDEEARDLVEELVEIQRVALRDGEVLAWVAAAPSQTASVGPERLRLGVEGERRQLTVVFCDLVGSTPR